MLININIIIYIPQYVISYPGEFPQTGYRIAVAVRRFGQPPPRSVPRCPASQLHLRLVIKHC